MTIIPYTNKYKPLVFVNHSLSHAPSCADSNPHDMANKSWQRDNQRMSTASEHPFIAVDWGHHSFRAALVAPDGEILDELAEPRGVLSFKKGEFANYLIATCARFTKAGGYFYLLSGMVGSQQALAEVPYCPCPATAAHLALMVGWAVKDRVAIVPGVRSEYFDVMRGEETQVFGAAAVLGLQNALMVLPGTHSKWVNLEDGAIVGFNTFMTGEISRLLAQHSSLAQYLPAVDTATPLHQEAFVQGIEHATTSESLLNTAFSVYVKSQFKQLSPAQAASYLSGLVIGEELVSMQLDPDSEVIVVGTQALCERYSLALAHLQVPSRTLGTQTAWAGLHSIYTQMNFKRA
jgi:2-dehydro-3-deoxygalactonokinase